MHHFETHSDHLFNVKGYWRRAEFREGKDRYRSTQFMLLCYQRSAKIIRPIELPESSDRCINIVHTLPGLVNEVGPRMGDLGLLSCYCTGAHP